MCNHNWESGGGVVPCPYCRIELLELIIEEAIEEAGDNQGRSGQYISDVLRRYRKL